MKEQPTAGAVDTVLFDLDGTLLNTLGDLAAAVNHALKAHALPGRTEREVRAFLGNGYRTLIAKSVPSGTSAEVEHAVLETFKAYYEEHCTEHTGPYPGILDLLRQLQRHGVRTAIVSNKGNEAVKVLADRYFGKLVSLAIGESPKLRRKPAPDMLLAAMERVGSHSGRCLYVGDSEVDFATARAAGIPVLICLWGFRDREQLEGNAMQFVTSPDEILRAVCATP